MLARPAVAVYGRIEEGEGTPLWHRPGQKCVAEQCHGEDGNNRTVQPPAARGSRARPPLTSGNGMVPCIVPCSTAKATAPLAALYFVLYVRDEIHRTACDLRDRAWRARRIGFTSISHVDCPRRRVPAGKFAGRALLDYSRMFVACRTGRLQNAHYEASGKGEQWVSGCGGRKTAEIGGIMPASAPCF